MAQLANCPQCEHELLVPEGAAAGAWARCPSCRAFFQLKDATSRELATLEVIESAADATDAGGNDRHAEKTVADFSSMPTWAGNAEEDRQLPLADGSEDADPQAADEISFADLEALLDADDANGDDPPFAAQPSLTACARSGPSSRTRSCRVPLEEVAETKPLDLDAPLTESAEVAAQRIDAWFKSARTLADVPPLPNTPSVDEPVVDYQTTQEPEFEPTSLAAEQRHDRPGQ